ncbi:LytTR family transcriptional regulator DNA-binding domain-containing protein [Pseudonocardia hispaniensis]|uniref:LytTR family transcriptional regulator DNA-binding domain-containing protein n=1 Tax=Pseudonocardia hispaniensis TaxID=904933 RepID=A0ABW1J8W5_9PSEU
MSIDSGALEDTLDYGDQIAREWERFVAGEDQVTGVPADVVRSWFRCREEYRVDPSLGEAPAAPIPSEHASLYDVVFAELGGSAVSIQREVENLDCVVSVADGAGRILAAWGDRSALRRARDNNLAPMSSWAEGASGTNGIGTAVESAGPVLIRGAEHWCQGFQNWVCGGIAVRDVVTGEPAAILTISRWRTSLPHAVTRWLSDGVATAKEALRRTARQAGLELVGAFGQAHLPPGGGMVALDRAGKVVLADDQASLYLDVPACHPAVDPATRWEVGLSRLARLASENGRRDPSWIGYSQIDTQLSNEPIAVTVRPVFSSRRVIGSLVFFGKDEGEPLSSVGDAERYGASPRRIVGTRGDRLVLLRPGEVRFAEADGNDIWLSTDRGRLQSSGHSLDKLEGEFSTSGFLRVHRRFLVNLNHVREVERGFKGELFLVLDTRGNEVVPVSRRNAALVRRALGI